MTAPPAPDQRRAAIRVAPPAPRQPASAVPMQPGAPSTGHRQMGPVGYQASRRSATDAHTEPAAIREPDADPLSFADERLNRATFDGLVPEVDALPPDADSASVRAALERLHGLPADDPDRRRLRQHVVESHLPLVRALANRYRDLGEPLDDLVQVGTIGLIHAVDRFDPGRGTGLASYATPNILGEIRRHFRDRAWAVRVPRRLQELQARTSAAREQLVQRLGRSPTVSELARELGLEEEAVLEGLDAQRAYAAVPLERPEGHVEVDGALVTVDSGLDEVVDRESLRPVLRGLPAREKRILALRYFRGLSQSQIAEELGISQMHVSRLLARTLERLHQCLADAGESGAHDRRSARPLAPAAPGAVRRADVAGSAADAGTRRSEAAAGPADPTTRRSGMAARPSDPGSTGSGLARRATDAGPPRPDPGTRATSPRARRSTGGSEGSEARGEARTPTSGRRGAPGAGRTAAVPGATGSARGVEGAVGDSDPSGSPSRPMARTAGRAPGRSVPRPAAPEAAVSRAREVRRAG